MSTITERFPSSTSRMLILPISSGRICHLDETGLRGRSAMLSKGGVKKSLNLPLIRLRAISQRVGDDGLVRHVDCRGINGDVAFLFWATCSTGTAYSGSTGAVGRRVERPVDGGRGGVIKGASLLLGPFPVVLAGEAGFRIPDGTVPP